VSSQDSPEEIRRKMLDLPQNWWRTTIAAGSLIQWFKGHVLPLLLAGVVNQNSQYCVYTGVLLNHAGRSVWLTAGHVVDELQLFLHSPLFKTTQLTWLDGYDVEKAEVVPLHRRDIPMKSWREVGLDVGAVLPSMLDALNIQKNDKVRPIDAVIWKNLASASPEGYFAIGYPRPWSHHTETPRPDKKVLHSIRADIACIPLEPAPPPSDLRHRPEWTDPSAFYGRILPYLDEPTFEVDDIRGMSGGPILSVERDPSGRIVYRLVGVIQSWSPSLSTIRAEPVDRVAKVIEEWLANTAELQQPTETGGA